MEYTQKQRDDFAKVRACENDIANRYVDEADIITICATIRLMTRSKIRGRGITYETMPKILREKIGVDTFIDICLEVDEVLGDTIASRRMRAGAAFRQDPELDREFHVALYARQFQDHANNYLGDYAAPVMAVSIPFAKGVRSEYGEEFRSLAEAEDAMKKQGFEKCYKADIRKAANQSGRRCCKRTWEWIGAGERILPKKDIAEIISCTNPEERYPSLRRAAAELKISTTKMKSLIDDRKYEQRPVGRKWEQPSMFAA